MAARSRWSRDLLSRHGDGYTTPPFPCPFGRAFRLASRASRFPGSTRTCRMPRMPARRWIAFLRWLPGTLLLVGLAVVALRHVEWERFSEIVQHAEPAWLVGAVLLQF